MLLISNSKRTTLRNSTCLKFRHTAVKQQLHELFARYYGAGILHVPTLLYPFSRKGLRNHKYCSVLRKSSAVFGKVFIVFRNQSSSRSKAWKNLWPWKKVRKNVKTIRLKATKNVEKRQKWPRSQRYLYIKL